MTRGNAYVIFVLAPQDECVYSNGKLTRCSRIRQQVAYKIPVVNAVRIKTWQLSPFPFLLEEKRDSHTITLGEE